jgi:diacylglycerol kinase (ATP)
MGFVKSIRDALNGVWYVLRGERNARIHLIIAVLVFAAGRFLALSNAELAAIFFAILIVFLAEIVNTALEKTLDLIDTKPNAQIKIVKDMAAGAVLVAATGAIVIGFAIFYSYVLEALWLQR